MYYLEFREPMAPYKATKISFWCINQCIEFSWSFDSFSDKDGYTGRMYTGLFLTDEESATLLKLTFNV